MMVTILLASLHHLGLPSYLVWSALLSSQNVPHDYQQTYQARLYPPQPLPRMTNFSRWPDDVEANLALNIDRLDDAKLRGVCRPIMTSESPTSPRFTTNSKQKLKICCILSY